MRIPRTPYLSGICQATLLFILMGAPSDAYGGVEEFEIRRLCIRVLDEQREPVVAADVKLYSEDWPLCYPFDGFYRTLDDGLCDVEIPLGTWTIVVGGGREYRSGGSGRGLFLVRTLTVDQDITISIEPSNYFEVAFYDLQDTLCDVDRVHAGPSDLVPICMMPDIGRTKSGSITIHTNYSAELALFHTRTPNSEREGYFVFSDNIVPSHNLTVRSQFLQLSKIQLNGYAPDDGPGPIEWKFCFPYFDLQRHWGHTAFTFEGIGHAYCTPTFMNYVFYVKFSHPEPWTYIFHRQGIDLEGQSNVNLSAGGPLTRNLSILNQRYDNRTQFLLGPVEDSFGNRLQFYKPDSGIVKIPYKIRDGAGDRVLHSNTFEVLYDHLGFQVTQSFPDDAELTVDWDLGPYGGSSQLTCSLGDQEYAYQYDSVETPHFSIHAPAGFPDKTQDLAIRMEQAYGHFVDLLGTPPPITNERNFYIHPLGAWASYWGQELFLHGFVWWHPRDPASLGWEATSLHEIGHRMETELFSSSGAGFPFHDYRNEAVASMLAQYAIEKIHGQEFAWLHRKEEGQRFFKNLHDPNSSPYLKSDNLFFVVQSYLPKRYDPKINHLFFRNWIETCVLLAPLAYNEEETYAALYSKLAGENLCWLFQLCGFSIDETRIIEAIKAIPPK